MGHTRLGPIPKTRKWKEVVAAFAGADLDNATASVVEDCADIAAKALDAAEAGLDAAIDDRTLRFAFYLLTQVVLAAREDDWQTRLAHFGIRLSDDASLFDLTVGIQDAIDDYRLQRGLTSDIGEMAQRAAGASLSALAGPYVRTLFGESGADLTRAVRRLGTGAGFAELGQTFFGSLLADFLNFHLSRVSVAQLGGSRLYQVGDITRFDEALRRHCHQSARIVHDYCGEWYGKTEFREGITLANTSNFMAVAIKKLQAELREQRTVS